MTRKKNSKGVSKLSGKQPGKSGLVGNLRQRLFDRDFRIETSDLYKRYLAEAQRRTPAREKDRRVDPHASIEARKDLLLLVAHLATSLWRVRKSVLAWTSRDQSQDVRRVLRSVESSWDALAGQSVEVRDYAGQRHVTGMALKIVTFQPTPGVKFDMIAETIKPSVFYKDVLIQIGEVIVASPLKTPDDNAPGQPPPAARAPGPSPHDVEEPPAAPVREDPPRAEPSREDPRQPQGG